MNQDTITCLRSLADKIATELVFATPDSDNGLLPVNSLLLEIEELAPSCPVSLADGVGSARKCLDDVFAGITLLEAAFVAHALTGEGDFLALAFGNGGVGDGHGDGRSDE